MAKKRLQKKREAARASAAQNATAKAATPKVTTKKVEPLKVETKKENPVKVETKKTEPIKVETKKVEAVKVETKKVEPIKVETKKTEPVKVETKKTETIQVEAKKEEAAKVETAKVEPVKVETVKTEPVKLENKRDDDTIYCKRLAHHLDELKWLYCELYQDNPYVTMHLNDLLKVLKKFYDMRSDALKESDLNREKDPAWYMHGNMSAMTMDVHSFADTFTALESKMDYVQECGINTLHLLPVLAGSDNGYAISDFRKIQEELGSMDDLASLAAACHKRNINVGIDLVMNHTSDHHEWAKRALAGEKEYQDRYFFFDNYDIPSLYEQTCPEVFPTTAPGNFTWLEDVHKHVMTTFHSCEWDLNYRNPLVLNEMIFNMLYLANQGVDILHLDAVSYIWKQIGTNCRNLPQVHTIIRIMRMISEIVCPGVLLVGEISAAAEEAASYFGTAEKPEFHLLDTKPVMADIWHTVATRDVSLLRHQMDRFAELPKEHVFLNPLRTYDTINWNLDYDYLADFSIQETPHRNYLNDFLSGNYPDSFARGELYSSDPYLDHTGLCGTAASLCGIERFGFEGNQEGVDRGVRYDITLHAFVLSQSGIPVICSGDELGQVNDYTYKEDPNKAADSRNLHRGAFDWKLAENRHDPATVQGKLFPMLAKLEHIRAEHSVFNNDASLHTIDTWDTSVLAFVRENEDEKFIGIYNFSENDKVAWIDEEDGMYTDLISGHEMEAKGVQIPAFGCYWLCRRKK